MIYICVRYNMINVKEVFTLRLQPYGTMKTFLSTVEPFKHLPAEDQKEIAALFRERHYAKGEAIFHEGESCGFIWVVKTGRVHLMWFSENGKAYITCVMVPGEAFYCLPALDQRPYPADAVAAEESTVIAISIKQFQKMLSQSSNFMQKVLYLFCS